MSLRFEGDLGIDGLVGSMHTSPVKILKIQIRSTRRRRLFMEKRPRTASGTYYRSNLSAETSLLTMRWTFSILVTSLALVVDQT